MRYNPNVDPARQRIATHKTRPAISITRAFPSISILPPIAGLLEQGAAVAIGFGKSMYLIFIAPLAKPSFAP